MFSAGKNLLTFWTVQCSVAYMMRFIQSCRFPTSKPSGPLSFSDSLLVSVEMTLKFHFQDRLKRNRFSKPLRNLNAFFDERGVLRVGERLSLTFLSYDKSHPIHDTAS